MEIQTAEFIKGIRGPDDIYNSSIPQVVFVGRSNVGKSSVINSLVNRRKLARSSPTPGRTREINFYLVNNNFYLVDLPGYGYAKTSKGERDNLLKLISWYLLESGVEPKIVVLVIDVKAGITDFDAEALENLAGNGENVIILANKIDKLKQSDRRKFLKKIEEKAMGYKVIPYSAEKRLGVAELAKKVFY